MRDLIRKILHEEPRKNLVPLIKKLIDGIIVRQYEKEICDVDIDVIEAGEYKSYLVTVTFDIDHFKGFRREGQIKVLFLTLRQ